MKSKNDLQWSVKYSVVSFALKQQTQQKFPYQVVHGKPNWTAPITVSTKQVRVRLARSILGAEFFASDGDEAERVFLVKLKPNATSA